MNSGVGSTGSWIHVSRCYPLEPHDDLQAVEDVIDASEDRHVIPAGTICKFLGMDNDGDVILREGRHQSVIFLQDLDKLSLQ